MKNNIYYKVYNIQNLILAWRKARKGKTKKDYVLEFEKNLEDNLKKLKFELMSMTYSPRPLRTFILRDPKTRKISKSSFRDRIVHHALCNIIEPIFDKAFIHDSCANRKDKGNLFAVERFDRFKRKVTKNLTREAYCFKADIKHYFNEVDHRVLIEIIKRKVRDERVIWLIKRILANLPSGQIEEQNIQSNKGMPLGNLTSQFFANVYLNELDYFVKNILKAKYYIRYVDDFIILHNSKERLEVLAELINKFLNDKLKIELHPQKSRILILSKGIDFVGFRNFYYHRLLRKKNVKTIKNKIRLFYQEEISYEKLIESFQGWDAYARWANTYKLRRSISKSIPFS